MAKRKLTRKQKWRIEKIQAEKQQRLLKNESAIASLSSQNNTHTSQKGLIVAKHGKQIEVLSLLNDVQNTKQNTNHEQISLCHLRANIPDMVVGDQVIWTPLESQDEQSSGIIESLIERTSVLTRKDKHGSEKIIAANVSRVFIVIAPEPQTSPEVLDRYLCACELLKLDVVLIINKSDLTNSEAFAESVIDHYQNIVSDILLCSIHNPAQVSQLREHLSEHKSVFIGQSGVGKSSLVKYLINDPSIKTQTLSVRSGLGQHTTSTSRLYPLDLNSCIIDSPGIRDFDLDNVSLEDLQGSFREFQEITDPCKFRNCVHANEPGCKIIEAVDLNKISKLRHQNYLQLAKQFSLIR